LDELVDITHVKGLAATGKALLISAKDDLGPFTMWVPFSVIDPGSGVQDKGDYGVLTLARWFAELKGLIESYPMWVLRDGFKEAP